MRCHGILVFSYHYTIYNTFGDKNRWAIPLGVMVSMVKIKHGTDYIQNFNKNKHEKKN